MTDGTITRTDLVTTRQARDLTDRIKIAVEGTWHLITEAYTSRAYLALGYRNWDDYCTREFGTSRLRLPREERSEVVASLRESGLSIRAIATATGTGTRQVQESIREVWSETTPELDSDPVLTQDDCEALDDTEWCDCGDGLCECLMGECSCGQVSEFPDEPDLAPRITGTDGKSYPPPRPREPARKPLPNAFTSAVITLGKDTARIAKLADDDRFTRNANQVAQENLHDLIRARDALTCVIELLQPTH